MTKEGDTRSSARRRAEDHTSFERTTFTVPDGMKVVSLKVDTTRRFDFLNYRVGKGNPFADEGSLHYERTFYTHNRIGPEENAYICLQKTLEQPCYPCQWRMAMKAKAESDADFKKIWTAFNWKERQLFAIIDTEARQLGVQLLEQSFHNLGRALDNKVKAGDNNIYDNFSKWKSGLTAKLPVIPKTMGSGKPYACVETVEFSTRSETYDSSIEAQIPCLDDLLVFTPYAELKAIFLQESDDPVGGKTQVRGARPATGDDEDNPPPPKKQPKAAPVDDDDPPPPKKAPKAAAPADDEDERAPPKKTPKAAPVQDDDDPPPPKKAPKQAAPADDEDERTPPPKKQPKAAPADDDDPPPPKAKQPPVDENWDDNWDPPAKPAKGKKPADDDE